jgi:alpha-1,3-rhamnosyl/mannosyltransferase
VREEGLSAESVRFLGPPEDVHKPALYRGALAFLFPSRYEGFGLPPLEALACGTPVIASAVSALPEVVGDAGLLLAPDDVAGMSQALVRLAAEDYLRAKLGRRAIARAAQFSWQCTAERTLAAYRAVLD